MALYVGGRVKEMKEIERELRRLKRVIEESKKERDILAGRREEQLRRLREEFGCKTVPEAKKLLRKLEISSDKLERKIEKGFEELRERYEW